MQATVTRQGSIERKAGATGQLRACPTKPSAVTMPNSNAPNAALSGRNPAKITNAIESQPRPPVMPSDQEGTKANVR